MRNPLTHILGVDSNVAVLRELVRHGGALSASDIQGRSGLSRSGVRLGLISLEKSGIVVSEGSLATRLHRFNTAHFLSPQIAALYVAEKDRFTDIVESIRNSAGTQRSLLRSLWIYGSVARKEDGPESDLDIGLIADKEYLSGLVEAVRENLREPAARLGFLPNVVGLDLEDVSRLARDADPWWLTATLDVVVLAGDRPEEVPVRDRSHNYG
ncbi:hypothetical protein G6N73_07925 [Mesorhizobium camelthorni]|uniref:Nucleotidyltransferase domain-containing protein n=1 Tax=Allomesorhizobium camelthorni TaxID=475069 RepID=A0A6G4W930_9HYPH|nr:hypothetical protein [Mesorhizobium camelthorni]